MKICTKCSLKLTEAMFHKSSRNKNGLSSACRSCDQAKSKCLREKYKKKNNLQKVDTTYKKTCWICRKELSESSFYRSRSRKDGLFDMCKLCAREKDLQRRYGMGVVDKEEMYVAQDSSCKICIRKKAIQELVVDHDHQTAQVRGLLCDRCNLILYYFDNVILYKSVMKYLKK